MRKFINQKIKKNRGVTLLEALVAISIFTTSILAMVAVVANGVSNTNYAKTKIIASYLAQEGMEYVKNMRDTYALYDLTSSQNGWNSFVTKLNAASCQTGCYFNSQNLDYSNHSQPITAITLTACGGSCPALLYDSSTGKYGYGSGTNLGFSRKITTALVSANEIKITSNVSWIQGSGTYNMTFSESLFNWIE